MQLKWIFDEANRRSVLTNLGFSSELQAEVALRAEEIGQNPKARQQFLKFADRYIHHGEIPPEAPTDPYWRALLAMTGYVKLLQDHQSRGLPLELTRSTVLDLERWVNDVTNKNSGPRVFPLKWVLKPMRENLLEIGRLQYMPKSFSYPYRIFTNRKDPSRILALAEPGIQCNHGGWPVESEFSFETHLQEDLGRLVGNPVDLSIGQILSEPTTLDCAEWNSTLQKGDRVLDIHIPSGAPLREQDCLESLKAADTVFTRHFPVFQWKAFVCTSWLLDHEFCSILPSTSGIVSFGNLFCRLPDNREDFRQLRERALDNVEDWRTLQPRTSLQKSVIDHLKSGGTFRTTRGFRLRDGLTS